jgi:hypothetical protein
MAILEYVPIVLSIVAIIIRFTVLVPRARARKKKQ